VKRFIKNLIKRQILFLYKVGTRLGIHILPVHYYSPVPNIIELAKTKDIWAKKSDLPGIVVNLDQQVENIKRICLPFQSEYINNQAYKYAVKESFGPGFGYIEAQTLHAVVRHYKPKRIIEVGSGVSTWCILNALKLNKEDTGTSGQITCIEPNPSQKLRGLKDNRIKLIEKPVQSVPFDGVFQELEENDFLFIDSSHTVKPGSDVNYLYLEILPRLPTGVLIHIHDIYLPYDYSREVLQTFNHWTETSLIRAFLINNTKARIIFCHSHLHYDRKNALKEVFSEYNSQIDANGIIDKKYKPFEIPVNEHFPSSLYIQIQ